MTIRPLILGLAVLATGLGACSRSAPDAAPVENESTDTTVTDASPSAGTPDASSVPPSATIDYNAAAELPAPAAPAANSADDAAADAPAPAPDQQMMDDASATGMTSRASRGDRTSDDATAGQTEQK